MGYLRFTPAEYQAIARVRRLDLDRYDPHLFRLILVLSLVDAEPELAERIRSLRDGEVRLLRDHLRGEGKRRSFTDEEWRAIAEACVSVPADARFARPFQPVLVRHFRKACPSLARKLGRMSVTQFVQVFEQAQRRGT